MPKNENINIGLAFGDSILLSEFAISIGADLGKLKRQAQRCKALIEAGGVFYINADKFLKARQAAQEKKEAEKREKALNKNPESLSTTNNVGILRGQRTRLTNLNKGLELKIATMEKKIATTKDKREKSDLETARGKLDERLDSNKATLQVAIDRLEVLEQSGTQDVSSSKK